MKNALKEKIARGERTLGTFFELGSATAVQCLGLAGLDYIIIDTEHGPFDPERALEFVRTAKLCNITPLARVQEISRASILKLLDVGAMGLVVPCVNSVEEAKKIVEYGKYMPLGSRGVANTAGSGFWYEEYAQQGLPHYFEVSNRETLLLPQCETLGFLENIEEIVALDGVDGIYVGPFDLSCALGIPGEFSKPEFQAALRRVQSACRAAGKPAFIYAATEEAVKADFELGYDSVTYGMDATMLVNSFRAAKEKLLAL